MSIIKKFLSNRAGITTTEVLIIIVAVAVIGSTVAGKILPSLQNLHGKVETSITDINETGF